MKELEKLLDRIIQRINIDLRELGYDVSPSIKNLIPLNQMVKFYAFYGITPNHPLDFQFRHSSLAGSYFLGKCRVTNSILYKSDIRGDELKALRLLPGWRWRRYLKGYLKPGQYGRGNSESIMENPTAPRSIEYFPSLVPSWLPRR